ncbi:plasma-membrane choline transporter-domain-containing protein, partial [Endogone sp. FLAS-F59071]
MHMKHGPQRLATIYRVNHPPHSQTLKPQEYFNYYAYTQVAIYGKDFCTAAKDTWTLIKDRGIEAIINDNLT